MPGTQAGSDRFKWPDTKAGPWWLTLRWAEVHGRVECVGIAVESVKPADERVTTSLLRSIPLATLVEERRSKRVRTVKRLARGRPAAAKRAQRQLPAYTTPRSRYDPLEVASTYATAWEARREPTQAVAERFGVTRSAAGKLVARARSKGLLEPTKERRAGGGLTEQARRLLAEGRG